MKLKFQFLVVSLFITLSACKSGDKTQRINLAGEAQGTYFAITYYDAQKRDLRTQVDSILKVVDESVSLWVENSLISRVNNGDSGVALDSIFRYNFHKSQQVSELTDGYFDFTIGPLAQAWGFHRKHKMELNDRQIDSLRSLVDYRKVYLQGDTVIMDIPHMRFDFNAIAQGYTTDLIAAYFDKIGIDHYLIDVGGEIYARNRKPDGSRWRVGIEKPSENADDARVIQEIIELENGALATSGSYRKYFEKDGKRYSHAINPKTGRPVEHNLLSVTVMASDAATADAFATAFLVMGLEKSKIRIQTLPGLEAYFIFWTADKSYGTYVTEGMKKAIVAN